MFVPHLGCPRDCVFCNQRSIAAEREPTREELDAIIERGVALAGDGAELAFYGGSFTAIDFDTQEMYLSAASDYLRDGRLCGIRVSTRPDCIDEKTLFHLRSRGVKTIELGAQSMEDAVLEMSNRGHTAAETVRASALIKSHGFSLVLQMMVGLPGEDEGSPMRTARAIADCGPECVRIYPVAVLKGTRLEQMWRDGEYTPLETERAAEICAELIEFFEGEGIRVIRVGLNPTDSLGGEVVTGVYHSAFGELCFQEIYLKNALRLLGGQASLPREVTICVGRGRTSMMTGQHRRNILRLKEAFPGVEIRITESELAGYDLKLII